MRIYLFLILPLLLLSSCDCMIHMSGYVVDKETKKPLGNVTFGRYEKEDADNPYTRKENTDSTGAFDYTAVTGFICSCQAKLYFSRPGYESLKYNFNNAIANDTIYLEKAK